MMKKQMFWMLTAILPLSGSLAVSGQEAGEQFTVATLNVDGLPQQLLVVKLNADGPGASGTARIGKYLAKKGYDLVMMQEDFNYHDVLGVLLEDDYRLDEWSGDIGVEGRGIDFLHLQNHRFDCDGLMASWKNDLTVTPTARTPWQQNFGKFSHANDEMVTKGFRRYDVTLRSGSRLVVYNMHMDATLEEDEAEQNDAKDTEARAAQWEQLRDDVLQNLDSRPVIITGDMNSLYGRDDVKTLFIDAINDSGRGTASDVWVEMQQDGVYPTAPTTEATANSETLDKILYINPVMGTQIAPVAFSIDKDGYQYDGKPLGDHYPVAATFQIVTSDKTTSTSDIPLGTAASLSEERLYNLNGQRISQPSKGVVIKNGGKKVISDK